MLDSLQRPLRDLRLSVTDRCNFRCRYCMPKEVFGHGYDFLPKDHILSFEEIARIAEIFVNLGAGKLRVTGGEPLLRRDIHLLVRQLAGIRQLGDLTLTTNGSLLAGKAAALREAGLHRLTVSLDSIDETRFAAMNDVDFPVAKVLAGIDAALAAGFAPIKVNMVVKRGVNDCDIVAMARHFSGPRFVMRFIEYMDVGNSNGWRMDDVVPASEIVGRIAAALPLEPLPPNYGGETAIRYRLPDGGEMGIVASVTRPFCRGCTRARLTADGNLFTCLFASKGCDLRGPLRSGATDAEMMGIIRRAWTERDDRYSEIRSSATIARPKPEMSLLGG